MKCLFEKCELINGLLIGLLASILASIIVLLISNLSNRRNVKRKYGRIEGNYKGYGYLNDNSFELNQNFQSEARITYIRDNQLRIELADDFNDCSYKWAGTIIMELENYGSIAWSYERYKNEEIKDLKHKFGVKRVIVKEDENKIYLYLAEENIQSGEAYEREVLIREK